MREKGREMVTDEERREVAARLRKCNFADGTSDVAEIEGIDEKFASRFVFVPNLVREIFAHDTKAVFSFLEIGDRLADLIDRPTCHMTECGINHGSCSWGMRCSECGAEFEHVKPIYGWAYCPKCGAEVIEDE